MKYYNLSLLLILILPLHGCKIRSEVWSNERAYKSIIDIAHDDKEKIIVEANAYLAQKPTPITNFYSPRSAGGKHDFHSEGDYWWPDPENENGPYIQRDGLSNPDIFNEHREAMRNLNKWVSTLTAAYLLTNNLIFSDHAILHLHTFFLNPDTKMNPSLLYAQAIKGRFTGRGIGIIDTIHFIEITRAIKKLKAAGVVREEDFFGFKKWFDTYATWMNSHTYGLDEKNHGNNHSTWWTAQLAAFTDLAERDDLKNVAVNHFKKLINDQMHTDGSFPDEIKRTKGYSYSLFNLEGYSIVCYLLSDDQENLWNYRGKNGSLENAWNFMYPFMIDKSKWIKEPDIAHFDELPIRSVGLLMATYAYANKKFFELSQQLSPIKNSDEIARTFPLCQPILWF